MSIAGLDEVSDFLCRLGINDPTEARWLAARHAHHSSMIRDHSDLDSTNTTMTRDHLLRIVSLKLVEMTIIEQTPEQLSHVVRLTVIFGDDFVELFCWSQRRAGGISRVRTRGLW